MRLLILAFLCLVPLYANAEEYDLRTGVDVFTKRQSSITALHNLSMMREVYPSVFLGGRLISSAGGTGGGLFIGGAELAYRLPLNQDSAIEFDAFVGGGGGANVVAGDGFMTRVGVNLRHNINERFSGSIGLSYIDISGSAISTPALSFGLSTSLGFAVTRGHSEQTADPGGIRLSTLKPVAMAYFPVSSQGLLGIPIQNMGLLGAELEFSGNSNRFTSFVRALGAMSGDGAGYAEWTYGLRWHTGESAIGLRGFAELGAGFAGGGKVDTGGGMVATAGAGVGIPITGPLEAELGVGAIKALGGDFTAYTAFARAVLRFGSDDRNTLNSETQRWQLSSGLSAQVEHDGLRYPGVNRSGDLVLVAFSMDYFVSNRGYVFGEAQSVASGQAGGYALGALGAGYEFPLGNSNWSLASEVFVGAAAGGLIATGSGLIGGGRVELDYALTDQLKLSAGVGQILSDGTAHPVTVSLGLKVPLTSFH